MEVQKNIQIPGAHKKPILTDVFCSKSKIRKPVVIFCHGYKGFKDWGAWNIMAKSFDKAGFCFVKFNFSHNGGTVEQPIDFPDLEAFGNNNYTLELDDLKQVVNWVFDVLSIERNIDLSNVTLMGHSRGGGIVTIYSELDPRITNVITLAGVSDFKIRFNEGTQEFSNWKDHGVKYVLNGRTKQQMPHYYQFFEDFKKNEKRLTIKRAAENICIPHLIIHGDQDTSVSLNEGKDLHRWNPKSILKIITGANHVFGTSHPWEEKRLSAQLQIAVDQCISFLKSD